MPFFCLPTPALRRAAFDAAARAGAWRAQHSTGHGIARLFICLSGVTAMLSAAVRKA